MVGRVVLGAPDQKICMKVSQNFLTKNYSLANFDEVLVEQEEDDDTLFIDLEILAQIRKNKTPLND